MVYRVLLGGLANFTTPFGVRIPTHWQILTPMISKPIHEANGYVPAKNVGVEAHVSGTVGNLEVEATGYLSNGVETSGTDVAVDGLTGVGGDIRLSLREQYHAGVSVHRQALPDLRGRAHVGLVAYLDLFLPENLTFRAEHTVHWRGQDAPFMTVYALATYTLHPYDRLTAGYRIGHGADYDLANGELHTSHTFNLALEPAATIRVVVEAEIHRFPTDGQPYRATTIWLGASF
ncbi:MAG: hypothetical protein ACI9MC_000643 [Kiritimatiellia bacterium]